MNTFLAGITVVILVFLQTTCAADLPADKLDTVAFNVPLLYPDILSKKNIVQKSVAMIDVSVYRKVSSSLESLDKELVDMILKSDEKAFTNVFKSQGQILKLLTPEIMARVALKLRGNILPIIFLSKHMTDTTFHSLMKKKIASLKISIHPGLFLRFVLESVVSRKFESSFAIGDNDLTVMEVIFTLRALHGDLVSLKWLYMSVPQEYFDALKSGGAVTAIAAHWKSMNGLSWLLENDFVISSNIFPALNMALLPDRQELLSILKLACLQKKSSNNGVMVGSVASGSTFWLDFTLSIRRPPSTSVKTLFCAAFISQQWGMVKYMARSILVPGISHPDFLELQDLFYDKVPQKRALEIATELQYAVFKDHIYQLKYMVTQHKSSE